LKGLLWGERPTPGSERVSRLPTRTESLWFALPPRCPHPCKKPGVHHAKPPDRECLRKTISGRHGSPLQSLRRLGRYRLSGPGSRAEQNAVLHLVGLWSQGCRHLDFHPPSTGAHLHMEQSGFRPEQQGAKGGSSPLGPWSRYWRGQTEIYRHNSKLGHSKLRGVPVNAGTN
jgi:hypothetical protein